MGEDEVRKCFFAQQNCERRKAQQLKDAEAAREASAILIQRFWRSYHSYIEATGPQIHKLLSLHIKRSIMNWRRKAAFNISMRSDDPDGLAFHAVRRASSSSADFSDVCQECPSCFTAFYEDC